MRTIKYLPRLNDQELYYGKDQDFSHGNDHELTTGMMVPASVWILYSAAFFPSRSAKNLAMQRIPLPHISGCAFRLIGQQQRQPDRAGR